MASHTAAAPFVFSSRHARKAPTRGGGVSRGSRSGRGAAVVTAALADVPANEVAGFIIGGGLVALVFTASKLDGIIAKAQVKGFEEDRSQSWKVTKPTKGQGNIFITPEDEERK